ncbi:HD domain-containing phosphohydrolase [Acetobacterium tundrae]|uniref:Diguanylate cyclase n=1 Tax=Acetobacterium tundrae TaxID=132932 RepID=A0ABR6WIG2_9FIRM|nr:HD domain-containing phosphohydrolase [Acetobacterium tundrae]MBC3796295.1 diguanylate cyclase [Acetobacterium tundrae]
MDIQQVLLNLIVFTLPIISVAYTVVGIRLFKQKVEGRFNFFSLFMFAAAIYAFGYFLALNSLDNDLFLIFRSFEYLGVVFIPTCGMLFVSGLTKNKLPFYAKAAVAAISSLLWLVYITNPIHHWTYNSIELIRIQGFSVAHTSKNLGYYLILVYYAVFLLFSTIALFKAFIKTNTVSLKRNYKILALLMQVSWIAVLVILLGFDKYLDPTPIVILFITTLIGYIEVKNDIFELEINRWKNTFSNIGEGAFLINNDQEIVCSNANAKEFLNAKDIKETIKSLDQEIFKRTPVKVTINNDTRWFYINKNDFDLKRKLISYILVDVSERNQIEDALKESEERHRLLITQMSQGLAVHKVIVDKSGNVVDYIFLDANESYERLTGLKRENIIGKSVLTVLPRTETYWIEVYGQVAMTGEPVHFENYSIELDKCFEVIAYSPRFKEFAVIISDISERKRAEEEISYLSYHDYLTGLYNRRFYEEELVRLDTPFNLPITLIMGDVNGLKLINDSFGHVMGDELLKRAAELISSACPKQSIVARLGGDEFIVILPQTDVFQAVEVIKNLKAKISNEKIGAFAVSISFGYETKENAEQDIQEIYKRAEDDMYRHKLFESASIKSKTIDLIMNTLYEKSRREMLHSKRVGELCKLIAKEMNFEKDDINQIRVAGLMHDIGKMGIDEKILNKEGELNDDEWTEIHRHPEIGYRILSASNEFSEISKYVLEHHERWDGTGYPKKLIGAETSIQARIIGVADAYDAMTCDRSYRQGLSEAEAIDEIRRCSGKQFDPEVARVLIEEVLKKDTR